MLNETNLMELQGLVRQLGDAEKGVKDWAIITSTIEQNKANTTIIADNLAEVEKLLANATEIYNDKMTKVLDIKTQIVSIYDKEIARLRDLVLAHHGLIPVDFDEEDMLLLYEKQVEKIEEIMQLQEERASYL